MLYWNQGVCARSADKYTGKKRYRTNEEDFCNFHNEPFPHRVSMNAVGIMTTCGSGLKPIGA